MSKVIIDVKKGFNNELTNNGLKELKYTQRELDILSREALTWAEGGLLVAKYDGNKDDVTVYRDVSPSGKKWSIVLSGPAALAVEYGSKSPGPDPWWFFSGKGASISLDAGGARAMYKRYLREDAEVAEFTNTLTKATRKEVLQEYNHPVWHYDDDGKRHYNPIYELKKGPKAFAAPKGKAYQAPSLVPGRKPLPYNEYEPRPRYRNPNVGVGYRYVKKKDSYITQGNKPNYIIKDVFQLTLTLLDKIGKGRHYL